jgi:hypothetical protein
MMIVLRIVFLVICVKNCFAQQDSLTQKTRSSNIQIAFGVSHTRLIDQGFTESKLLFRGTNARIVFGYGHETKISSFNFVSAVSAGKIRTKQSELAAHFLQVSFSIEYLRKLKTFGSQEKPSGLFAGLQFSTINYIIENSPVFDNIDALSLHGVYFKLRYQLELTKNQHLYFTWSIPVIVYTNRVLWNGGASVYDNRDKNNAIRLLTTHGRYSYFNIAKNIRLTAVYKKQIGKNINFNALYAFNFVNNVIERSVHLYSNELLLGLQFNF